MKIFTYEAGTYCDLLGLVFSKVTETLKEDKNDFTKMLPLHCSDLLGVMASESECKTRTILYEKVQHMLESVQRKALDLLDPAFDQVRSLVIYLLVALIFPFLH